MKLLKYLAGSVSAMAMLTACSDSFLEVESYTQDPLEDYFTTEARLQEAVVAAYDPLHWPDWAHGEYNPVNIMGDIMADDIWVGGADRGDNTNWHLMMDYSATPTQVIKGLWTTAYSGVKRCNDVLLYVDWVEGLDENTRDHIMAQAYVLKAFYWTWLWKFWGNVPFYDTNLTEYPYLAEQIPADELYAHIIKYLDDAIALNALPMKETADNYGRVTLAMAYMLYTEVVMYQNDESLMPKAFGYLNEIITSGQYDLHGDYADLFAETGEWCEESIFEINYKDDDAVRSWNGPLVAGGTVLPRLISPSGWVAGTDGHDNGWGFCPVRQETYDRYAEGDTRRDVTCWNAAAVGSYEPRYQDTGLFLGKYVALTGGNADQKADGDLNYNNNLRYYRYSETLLYAAELIARGHGAGDAAALLAQVRSRAGLNDQLPATVDNIIAERQLEFVGEGKRYWDLIRSGKAADVLVPDQYGYRTKSWSANKKYLPIAQSELDATQGTITQNNY